MINGSFFLILYLYYTCEQLPLSARKPQRFWIHYEFSCINNFSFIVYCVKMYVLNMRDNKKDKIRKLYFDSAHNKTVQHKL
jgi:hypothetical protein